MEAAALEPPSGEFGEQALDCVDHFEEADEFLVPVALHVAPNHGPVEDIQGGEQRRGSTAFVVVGHGAQTSILRGKTRLEVGTDTGAWWPRWNGTPASCTPASALVHIVAQALPPCRGCHAASSAITRVGCSFPPWPTVWATSWGRLRCQR